MGKKGNFDFKKLAIWMALAVSLIAVKARAEELESVNLADLLNIEVTTATKKAQKLDQSPGSITVITRKMMQDSNARTMRDVLNIFVPGMDVVPTYFRYGDRVSEGVYSRGLLSDFSQQVLFLLNGMGKFNEPTFSSSYPAIEFTLENVERIEVSRSPIPIYGGSAITIINIITREQFLKNGAEFFSDIYGQDKSNFKSQPLMGRRFSGNFGKSVNSNWRVSGSVQTYSDVGQEHPEDKMDGGYAGDPALLRDGTKAAMNASMVAQTEDKKWFIQTNYKEINRDGFLSGGVPSQSFGMYNYGGSHFLANVKYTPIENLEISLGGMRAQFENEVNFGGPFGGEIRSYDLYAEANYNYKFGSHSWLTGLKVENEGQHYGRAYYWDAGTSSFTVNESETALFAPNTNRTVSSVYSEDTWEMSENSSLVLGARYDHYNGFGGETFDLINPRIATSFKMSETTTMKLSYASASRPPSIYEKLGTGLTPLYGNKDVDPETVQTIELSAIYRTQSLKIQLTPFYQIFKDKIEFIPTAADLNGDAIANDFQADNNDDAKITGVDLDIQYYMDKDSYVFFNTSFVDSRDESPLAKTLNGTDKTQFLPQVYANTGINYRANDQWNFNVNAFYRGERELNSTFVTSKKYVKEHINANFSANYDWSKDATFYFLVENVAGEENFVPLLYDGYGVPLRDRTYHLGFKWTM